MTDPDRDEVARRQDNLRYLLNLWDPIGVAGLSDDEYDCMLAPLWRRLTGGASRADVSEYLWFELEDHFGLDPARAGVDDVADRLVALAASWTGTPEGPGR
jgi:hypothetical protein